MFANSIEFGFLKHLKCSIGEFQGFSSCDKQPSLLERFRDRTELPDFATLAQTNSRWLYRRASPVFALNKRLPASRRT